jgi:NAD(P)H-flavin reductase/hemoglobin-like flavoprotein
VDVARLKWSWSLAEQLGDQAALHFYSTLFLISPETREMFPIGMAGQRDKLLGALGRIVSNVDATDELVGFLQQLGRDHRKFGVVAEHFPSVGEALIATLAHFLGDQWTEELARDWIEAFGVVSKVMIEAADEAARISPPWWEAEVVGHERRTLDVAVLQVVPNFQLPYLPGQSVAVECHLRPRLWRFLSPANAPRPDGTLDLHVRHVPGGQVSAAMVQALRVGDVLRLGAAVGHRLTLPAGSDRDLLLISGGTGLAPLKAIVEQVAVEGARRQVYLFMGARTERDLYDLKAMAQLAEELPWFTVVPTVSDDPYAALTEQGSAVDIALRHGSWPDHEVFVCGSEEMVAGSVNALTSHGIEPDRIRFESFQRSAAAQRSDTPAYPGGAI